ncbi:MAG: hypothetical protein LBF74_05625 [Treponema sp.]|jgi:hypothetical protein|nr:hypothetical protein [Treponema sp.]
MAEKKKGKVLKIVLIVLGVIVAINIIGAIAGGSKSGNVAPANNTTAVTESAAPATTPAPKPRPEDDPNYTGAWKINNFVDEFGDETDERYVALWAEGKFSNSATKDEQLRVFFLITKDSVGIQAYEDYWGIENDVAATFILFSPATVTIRDKDGTDHRLRGSTPGSSGQRLYITPIADVLSVLKMGGLVRFSISANGSTYRFDIPSADYFDRAFEQIGG